MKYLATIIFISLMSCQKENNEKIDKSTTHLTNTNQTSQVPKSKTKTHPWDFNGEGHFEPLSISNIKGQGNPVENGTADSYIIKFENKNIPDLHVGCCQPLPIGEGDLNGDGKAELSLFQQPMNGCIHTMSTYTLHKGKWKLLFEPFLVPTSCEETDAETLDKLVALENGKIYILETDLNDENFKMNRKEVKLH